MAYPSVWTVGSACGPFIAGALSEKATWRWLFCKSSQWTTLKQLNVTSIDRPQPSAVRTRLAYCLYLSKTEETTRQPPPEAIWNWLDVRFFGSDPNPNLIGTLLHSGNFLIVTSTCFCIVSLTLGGAHFPWSSPRIFVPLLVGVAGLAGTLFYESRWPKCPVVSRKFPPKVTLNSTCKIPFVVLSNRTSLSGYVATFIQGMVTLSMACK